MLLMWYGFFLKPSHIDSWQQPTTPQQKSLMTVSMCSPFNLSPTLSDEVGMLQEENAQLHDQLILADNLITSLRVDLTHL